VRTDGRRPALRDLTRCPERLRRRLAPSHQFGQPEVQNLGLATSSYKNICGLDISRHDPFGVRRIERISNLDRQLEKDFGLQRLAFNAVLEGLPFEQFHSDEVPAVIFVDVVNGTDIGMVEG